MQQPLTMHAVPKVQGRHYPALTPSANPALAMQDQQANRANLAATRQQLVRMYLGGMQNQRPTLAAS